LGAIIFNIIGRDLDIPVYFIPLFRNASPIYFISKPEFANQLKLIINPPPASADDLRNDRLVIEVF
jgi:hypothetical protein